MNIICPGCGLSLPEEGDLDTKYNASAACKNRYYELISYTLNLGDAEFIHQYAVDAYGAQHTSENSKPVGVTFALIGLYLAVEHNYTGKQVQDAHIALAKRNKQWPMFYSAEKKNTITVVDVLKETPGEKRNTMMRKWVTSVWDDWKEEQGSVRGITHQYLKI